MLALMEQYRDLPMDLADASIVAAAESLDEGRVFTIDRHFHIYRRYGREPFEVVPSLLVTELPRNFAIELISGTAPAAGV